MRPEMPIKNLEGIKEFDIDPHWHENRPKGISAYLRARGDERWIGNTVESILPFFDEIVVTIDDIDRSVQILKNFHNAKIKIFDYPYRLRAFGPGYDKLQADSLHSFAYYTNWSVSKTMYSHVCCWDADMIMLPWFYAEKERFLNKNVVRFRGYDVTTPDFKRMSKQHPFSGPEARLRKVYPYIYYRQFPRFEGLNYEGLAQLFSWPQWKNYPKCNVKRTLNYFTRKDIKVMKPAFLHCKFIKDYWKKKFENDGNVDWVNSQYHRHQADMEKPGDVINERIPEIAFKKPEDYL